MMKCSSPGGWRPPPELTRGEVEEKTALLSFLGTMMLQMFPSQQDVHIWQRKRKYLKNNQKREIADHVYLVTVMGDVHTSGELAVLQGGAAFGYRHAASTVIHHVERVAVLCTWNEDIHEKMEFSWEPSSSVGFYLWDRKHPEPIGCTGSYRLHPHRWSTWSHRGEAWLWRTDGHVLDDEILFWCEDNKLLSSSFVFLCTGKTGRIEKKVPIRLKIIVVLRIHVKEEKS